MEFMFLIHFIASIKFIHVTNNQSIHKYHSIRVIEKNQPYAGGWFFIINILLLLLLLTKYLLFREFSKKSWNAWVNQNLFFQLIREKQPINAVLFFIEFVFKVYLLSLLVLLTLYALKGEWFFNFKSFIVVISILFAFFSLNHLN